MNTRIKNSAVQATVVEKWESGFGLGFPESSFYFRWNRNFNFNFDTGIEIHRNRNRLFTFDEISMPKSEFRFWFRCIYRNFDFDIGIPTLISKSESEYFDSDIGIHISVSGLNINVENVPFHWTKSKFIFWLLIGISIPTFRNRKQLWLESLCEKHPLWIVVG
jgi:hypothetical protein